MAISIKSITDQARGFFDNIVGKPLVQSAVKIGQQAGGYINNMAQPLASVSKKVGQLANDQVASIPFSLNRAKKAVNMATRPLVMGYPDRINPIGNAINERLPIKQPVLGGPGYDPNREFQLLAGQNNVDINPYNDSPAPPSNPQLEKIKQQVLSSPNLRGVAKDYQNSIPITYGKMGLPGSAAQADNISGQNPYITVSDTYRDVNNPRLSEQARNEITSQLETIIQHELLHQTPRLVPIKLFKPENQSVINEYTQRWGSDYMNNPRNLIEEMFAEQALPPAYYWHIFKSVNPDATQNDFIAQLRSYFINNINNPQPIQSIPAGIGITATQINNGRTNK